MAIFNIPSSALPFLQRIVSLNHVRHALVSMAAGRVLAQYAPLPPKDCLDHDAYFCEANSGLIAQYLDTIFTVVPIDFKTIQAYALKFYLIRCQIAHGCCAPSITGTNGVYNLYHVGTQLSEDELGMIKEQGQLFAGYISGFEQIYKDMQRAYEKS